LRSAMIEKPNAEQVATGVYGETSIILSSRTPVTDALGEIWRTDDDRDLRVARSEWLLRSLYIDQHIIKRLIGLQATAADDLSLAATRFALLITKVFSMPAVGANKDRAKTTSNWLIRRVLEGPLANEPGLLAKTSETIKRILIDVAPKYLKTKRARVTMYLLHEHFQCAA